MVPCPSLQPTADQSRFMGAVVIQHQVDIEIGWNGSIDPLQEIQELDGTMASIALAQDVAGGDIECSEKAGNAMPLVVVSASLQLSDPHGQHRLGTAQSLDLRLLIHA